MPCKKKKTFKKNPFEFSLHVERFVINLVTFKVYLKLKTHIKLVPSYRFMS